VRRPGFLTRYARHAAISVRKAAYQLEQCGVNYHAFFDFEEADRLRAKWLTDSDGDDGDGDDGDSEPYAAAKARDRHFKALLSELEYRKQVGELVKRSAVEAGWFRTGRQVRDGLLNIPPRIAGIVAAETDQRKVHEIIDAEIRRVLKVLSADENKDTQPGVAVAAEDNSDD
jgi:phage terminase Nu1 subunit (DNA packaging protein)